MPRAFVARCLPGCHGYDRTKAVLSEPAEARHRWLIGPSLGVPIWAIAGSPSTEGAEGVGGDRAGTTPTGRTGCSGSGRSQVYPVDPVHPFGPAPGREGGQESRRYVWVGYASARQLIII